MPLQKITEDELINKCIAVFRSQGYYGTSMQDLADACGLTKGNFYHYYPNKEALMKGVLKKVNSYFSYLFFKKLQEGNRPLAEKKQLFKKKALEMFDEQGGCIMGNTALESAQCNKEFRQLVRTFFSQWVTAMQQLYIKSGLEEQEALEKATHAVAQVEGSIMLMQVFEDRTYLEKALDKVLE